MESRRDNLALAVAVIVLTVLTLSFGDAVIKALSADLVLWQIFVLRSFVAIPLLLILLRVLFPGVSLIPRSQVWTVARSLMLASMWVVYYASLPHLQLSIAAAAYYTLPIFIALFSAVLVGEPVGRTGWFAVALGFVGTLLILKPAADAFNLYALLPVASGMLYALAMILTRTKCRDEHPLVLSAALNVTFILIGLFATAVGSITGGAGIFSGFMSPKWALMDGNEFAAVGLLGIAILVASIGTAIAYQKGPSSVVATFDFSYVGFAVIWGLVFFSELPDLVSLCGMALVVIAGIVSVRQ